MRRNTRRDFSRRMLNSNRRTRLNSSVSPDVKEVLIDSGNYSDEEVDQIIIAANAFGYSDDETIDTEWVVLPASSDEEFAEAYLEWTGELAELPDEYAWLIDYFDFLSYGRNLRTGTYTNNNQNGFFVIDLTNSSL